MKQNKIVKLLYSMTGLIIASKLLGFFKQILTASIFGATLETDAPSLRRISLYGEESVLSPSEKDGAFAPS